MAKHDSRRTLKLPRYSGTYHGVHKFYEYVFEKLGWMILAKAKGFTSKIQEYKRSIARLGRMIDHLEKEYEDHNRVHDLKVMRMNVAVLKEHVDRDF
jgi:hypothetical protein